MVKIITFPYTGKTFSRNYFETSYGKGGGHDAVCGAVKRQLDYMALNGVSIQNATLVYEIVLSSYKDLKSGICKRRVFSLIQDIDRTDFVRYQPILENRKKSSTLYEVCQTNFSQKSVLQ